MRRTWLIATLLLGSVLVFAASTPARAHQQQQAGGEERQTRTWVVSQRHANAGDDNAGTAAAPFESIAPAAARAQPGDTVLARAGVYRERVAPARGGTKGRPIVYQAAVGEEVVIKGSDRWQPDWQRVSSSPEIFSGAFAPGMFRVKALRQAEDLPGALPATYNPYRRPLESTPAERDWTLGQFFVDGEPLKQVGQRERLRRLPGSWMVRPDTSGLLVHFPRGPRAPSDYRVELTTRGRVFAPYQRGFGYIHVRGFTMEHGATNFPRGFWDEGPPQAGIVGTRAGHHWVIANNTIRYGKTFGLDIGTEGTRDFDRLGQPEPDFEEAGRHLIRGNVITDHGAGGIEGIGSFGTRIIGNRIERNNRLGFTAPEIGGIKVHFFVNGRIKGNLVRDNDAFGIWIDQVWQDARLTRNVVVGNQGAGIFVELGRGPALIDNNVVALTRGGNGFSGDGLYSHDASGVTVAHNLFFYNANMGLWAHVATDRTPGFHKGAMRVIEPPEKPASASRWRIQGNMFFGNHAGAVGLPAESERSQNNASDYNLFAGPHGRLTPERSDKASEAPLFVVNTNSGRIALDEIATQFEQQLDGAGVSMAQRPTIARWEEAPYLRFDEWQLLTGEDWHSYVPVLESPVLASRVLRLSFAMGPVPDEARPPLLEQIERDFFGHPMPEAPLPGPFQALKTAPSLARAGEGDASPEEEDAEPPLNVFTLWPLPPSAVGERGATGTAMDGGR